MQRRSRVSFPPPPPPLSLSLSVCVCVRLLCAGRGQTVEMEMPCCSGGISRHMVITGTPHGGAQYRTVPYAITELKAHGAYHRSKGGVLNVPILEGEQHWWGYLRRMCSDAPPLPR